MTVRLRYGPKSLELLNRSPFDRAQLVGMDATAFQRTTLKKHNPRTVRKNVGDSYRGCLAIYVTKSAELYRRMEGAWYGIVLGADSAI